MRVSHLLAGLILVPSMSFGQSVSESAQLAADAAKRAEAALEMAVPAGAVMAFDLEACPKGWTQFQDAAGRVIVGAGSGNRDQNDKRLTDRAIGQTGGAETHKLTVKEIPSHTHTYKDRYFKIVGGRGIGGTGRRGDPSAPSGDFSTGAAGSSEAHNNMQPYLVLIYCRRL